MYMRLYLDISWIITAVGDTISVVSQLGPVSWIITAVGDTISVVSQFRPVSWIITAVGDTISVLSQLGPVSWIITAVGDTISVLSQFRPVFPTQDFRVCDLGKMAEGKGRDRWSNRQVIIKLKSRRISSEHDNVVCWKCFDVCYSVLMCVTVFWCVLQCFDVC
jgi:sorbitol-specific phosphotransferase system component IIA